MEDEKKKEEPIITESVSSQFTEPTEVEIEQISQEKITYLKNIGEPNLKTINSALKNSWITIEGKKYNVMVIWPVNRNNDLPWDDKADSQEATLSKQMGLKGNHKAYVYFDPEYGTGVPEKGWSKVLYIKQEVPLNHSFTVQDYPHIINYPLGIGGIAGERTYSIKVGETTRISHQGDFKKLWDTFGFLDEVDATGKVIKENTYTGRKNSPDKPVDKSRYNPTLATEVDHRDLPSEYKKNLQRLGEETLDIKEAGNLSDLDTASGE
jgi:hypothetical protein